MRYMVTMEQSDYPHSALAHEMDSWDDAENVNVYNAFENYRDSEGTEPRAKCVSAMIEWEILKTRPMVLWTNLFKEMLSPEFRVQGNVTSLRCAQDRTPALATCPETTYCALKYALKKRWYDHWWYCLILANVSSHHSCQRYQLWSSETTWALKRRRMSCAFYSGDRDNVSKTRNGWWFNHA